MMASLMAHASETAGPRRGARDVHRNLIARWTAGAKAFAESLAVLNQEPAVSRERCAFELSRRVTAVLGERNRKTGAKP